MIGQGRAGTYSKYIKGNTFCMYENIENYGNYIFQKLKEENYLINTAKDVIYDRFSFFMSEKLMLSTLSKRETVVLKEFLCQIWQEWLVMN